MKCHFLPSVILLLAVATGGTNPQAAEVSGDAKPSVTVFPVVTTPDNRFPDDLAKRVGIAVATLLEKAGLEDLEVAETMFNPPKTDGINKIAEAFGKHVGEKPIKTDYAVYADYGLSGPNVHHVHVILCDQSGNWVLIDMQNSHHPDFARIDPKSAADFNRLLLARLQGWLSE